VLRPDSARVLIRPFLPATGPSDLEQTALARIPNRVLAMDQVRVEAELEDVMREFGDRHVDLRTVLTDRFQQACSLMRTPPVVPEEASRLLIGAYFSLEYSFESVALFNPSIISHPDQGGLASGEVRFIISLRATGEGHISSICFRSGIVDANGDVRLDTPGRHATMPLWNGLAHTEDGYEVAFPPGTPLAERVIFPITPKQRHGIEDARFVRFVEDDGTAAYYATYTAYSGLEIAPELLRTEDFLRFRFLPIQGKTVRNKGMALFPRRVGGQYAMLARLDGETMQLMRSDDLQTWNEATTVLGPAESWEFFQIGNCGSPIELPEGWLVLTHGVGSMRRYSIGAVLLDLHDPTRVLGRLRSPLLSADEQERGGYVPNVVYSCGGMVHAGNLILPYAISDTATKFAVVPLGSLLAAMS
jgi:predicted GH43/DUF377 family glycosyl hydrolase